MKSIAKTRYERFRHIERKKRIIKDQNNYWYYKHEGVLSKGKIHCSCPMCRMKTTNKGKNKSKWLPSHNPKISDLRKEISMDSQLEDYFNGEF